MQHTRVGPDAASLKSITLSRAAKYVGALRWPVKDAKVISYFGKRWGNFHEGLDIGAKQGTPIVAAHEGEIIYSGDGFRGYGNMIVVKGDGLLTIYAHCKRNLVDTGDRVKKGDHIADVGMTGQVTGPHLHFETRIKDQKGLNVAVDPLAFYKRK